MATSWQQDLVFCFNFEIFSQAFLAHFVKPSDSAKARAEISHLKQIDLIESFAPHFRNVNSRISVGSPTDMATLANYFVHGLKKQSWLLLCQHISLPTMQELDLVLSAAEEMQAKLNLAAKQDQPGTAAVTSGYGTARNSRGSAGGRSPYGRGANNAGRGNGGRGNNGRGRSHQDSGSRFAAASPAHGANAEPLGGRIVNHVGKIAGAKPYNAVKKCTYCKHAGHSIHDCRKLDRSKAETPKPQGPGFSTNAYLSAYAVSMRQTLAPPHQAQPLVLAQTFWICLTSWQTLVRQCPAMPCLILQQHWLCS